MGISHTRKKTMMSPTKSDVPVRMSLNFLSACSEENLKQFNFNCLNQIDLLEKAIAELVSELAMWRGRMEAAQEFIAHREEIIEALRTQAMKRTTTIANGETDK